MYKIAAWLRRLFLSPPFCLSYIRAILSSLLPHNINDSNFFICLIFKYVEVFVLNLILHPVQVCDCISGMRH